MAYGKNSFDAAGTCASEVRNPGESYPRAMRISVMLIVAMYGLPALIGFSVIPDPSKWKSGSYMMIAKTIGGHFLEVSCPKFNLCFNKFIAKAFV
jgi:amino acid transporter